jgi:hypothetical protein
MTLFFFIYFTAFAIILEILIPYGLDKLSSYIIAYCFYDFVEAQ